MLFASVVMPVVRRWPLKWHSGHPGRRSAKGSNPTTQC